MSAPPTYQVETVDPLLNIKEVSALVGLKQSAIYDRLKNGRFAVPIRLSSRCTRWRVSAVKAWISQQEATA